MFGWLRKNPENPAPAAAGTEPMPAADIAWMPASDLPIPDWERQSWPVEADPAQLHGHGNRLAAGWLDALAARLPEGGYRRAESANFMLLSTLEPRPARVLLDYLEKSLRRVLGTLPGVASDEGYGKYVVLVFHDDDAYYRYISHYSQGTEESPEGFSSGMFIHAGYGHFVFAQGPFESMEAVVVHELTHCVVAHLDIPAWLNEGLAVNTEKRFKPAPPRYRPQEREYLFAKFWNEATIQEFWSGKSFMRPDDGQPLSYELAQVLVSLIARDYEALRRFCVAAKREDGGEAAADGCLGHTLAELAAAVLGPGEWAPRPQAWAAGTEKGQFTPPVCTYAAARDTPFRPAARSSS